MSDNLPDSIFIKKELSEKEKNIRIPFIKELKGDPVMNGENDIAVNVPSDTDLVVSIKPGLVLEKGDFVFYSPPMMRRFEMYETKTNKKVAEWEEPVDDVLS